MQLTVLGVWGGFPSAGGACPGYLLQGPNYKVLIDCGSGVVSRLLGYCALEELDCIICTHLHTDHISDLFVLRYGYFVAKQAKGLPSLPVYTPGDRQEELSMMDYKGALQITTLNADTVLNIGSLVLRFQQTAHGCETYAVRAEEDGKVFVYSSDTGYDSNIVALAQGADLLLCESTLLEAYRKPENEHCTAKDAGQIASEAGVKKLLLTHFWYEIVPGDYLNECRNYFPALNVDVAQEQTVYRI